MPPVSEGPFALAKIVTSHLPVVPASERNSNLNLPGYFASMWPAVAEACL